MAGAADTMEAQPQAAPAPRASRITNACEACRAAKVRCQASTQLGICKRCIESKRECIFKKGPRTRRPRQKRANPASASASSSVTAPPRYHPPPGPSKTFTIDVSMPTDNDIVDSLEALCLVHERAIDNLVPHISEGEDEDDYEYDGHEMDQDWLDRASGAGSVLSHASSLPMGASALSTPPSSVVTYPRDQGQAQAQGQPEEGGAAQAKSRTMASLRLQPQFNLDSAGELLSIFKDVMLPHFHCIVIRDDETVSSMAKERPFVLLAVLAAASGSRTLQGHSLYDEEFRKVLGLKFVAGGERTLELLQGLMVYTAWYPFHLRPKNKQAVQYVRMAVDIVDDLELDEDPGTDSMEASLSQERLAQIRVYLATYYMASAFAAAWGRNPSLTYTDCTARCCDLLQHHSRLRGDQILAWQVRLERCVDQTNELRRTQRGRSQAEHQIDLMIRGMETQLAEWEAHMDPAVASTPSVRIATLFARVFLSGAPLLMVGLSSSAAGNKRPRRPEHPMSNNSAFRPDPRRLISVVPHLRGIYECFLSLGPVEINALNGMEWGNLILAVMLGFRMSFPLPVLCPVWDDRAGRAAIEFGEYIERLCKMGDGVRGADEAAETKARLAAAPGSGSDGGGGPAAGAQRPNVDVLGASKVVLEMVRKKFVKRVARTEAQAAAAAPHPLPMDMPAERGAVPGLDSTVSGCPMMDGSMEPYYPYWNETFTDTLSTGVFAADGAQGLAEGAAQADMDAAGLGMANDLWTAMTMGWVQQGHLSFESF